MRPGSAPPPLDIPARRFTPVGTAALALLVFLLLASQLVFGGPLAVRLDPAVSATELHSTRGIDLMLAAVAIFLGLVKRRWRAAVWLVASVQGAMLLNVGLKHLFARPRPALGTPMVHLASFSFPSGHAVASTAFWACIALLVPPRWRLAVSLLALALASLVAFSRVYLGAHYLSDVLAGMAVGLFCVSLAQALRHAGH